MKPLLDTTSTHITHGRVVLRVRDPGLASGSWKHREVFETLKFRHHQKVRILYCILYITIILSNYYCSYYYKLFLYVAVIVISHYYDYYCFRYLCSIISLNYYHST